MRFQWQENATRLEQRAYVIDIGLYAGHPRLCRDQHRQSWMAGTGPGMTIG
jgi:hypothetical protein